MVSRFDVCLFLVLRVAALGAVSVPVFAAHAGCADGALLTLLHFNDFHGQLEAESVEAGVPQVGGIARLATAVETVRAADPDRQTLLLFAGDFLQGTVTSSLFLGVPDVAFFGRLGVDAAVVGNHEFDYGQDVFRSLVRQADFPMLSANLEAANADWSVEPAVTLSKPGGMKVAVIGLTTPELTTATHPRNVVGVRVHDPVTVAAKLLPKLRSHSDLVVVLSHLGVAEDRRLARSVAGIDLIVGGHNHHVLQQPVMENGVPILQAGERGRWLGRMDVVCRRGHPEVAGYQLMAMDQSVRPEPTMAADVRRILASAESELTEVVGMAPVALSADRAVIRRSESVFGDFVADLARESTGADIALFNAGGFRASIPAGKVTLKSIYEAFPFRNELVVGHLTGAQLAQVMRQSAALAPNDNPGGFLQVSGLRYSIRGRDLETLTVAGMRVDPEREYRIVVPDFLAAGGDGYLLLGQMKGRVMTGRLISDMLVDAFRNGVEVNSKPDGRISRADER